MFEKDLQYYKFSAYGFLKNLRLFEPFLILFLLDAGLTYFQIGVLYSIRELVKNLAEIPSGFLADVWGRKKAMILSFFLYIFSFMCFYFGQSYPLFVLAIVFFGFAEAFRSGTHKAMIYHYLELKGWEKHKIAYYGNTRSWSQLGSAISSLIAGFIMLYTGNYKMIFLLSIVPYMLDLINLISYPSFLNKPSNVKKEKEIKLVLKEFLTALKDRTSRRILLNSSTYSAYYSILKDLIQPVIKALAISIPLYAFISEEKRTAILIGVMYFLIYLLSSYSSRKAKDLSKKLASESRAINLTYVLGFLIGIIGSLMLYFDLYFISACCFIVILLIENIRKPISMSYIASLVRGRPLASILSVEAQLKTLFMMILTPLVGLIADRFGLAFAFASPVLLYILIYPFVRINLRTRKEDSKN